MIGHLRGRLAAKHPPQLLIDVGGVGYEVEAPMSTFYGLPALGADVSLHTHLVVREDAHVLFGFGTERERSLFRELIKVSGVGPRIALGILSGVSVDDFHRCIESNDAASLTRVPGIGRKTAERLIVEMRDGLKALAGPAFEARGPAGAVARIWMFEIRWQIREGGSSAQWMPVRICFTRRASVSLPSSNQLTSAPARVNSRSGSSCGTLRRIGMK